MEKKKNKKQNELFCLCGFVGVDTEYVLQQREVACLCHPTRCWEVE